MQKRIKYSIEKRENERIIRVPKSILEVFKNEGQYVDHPIGVMRILFRIISDVKPIQDKAYNLSYLYENLDFATEFTSFVEFSYSLSDLAKGKHSERALENLKVLETIDKKVHTGLNHEGKEVRFETGLINNLSYNVQDQKVKFLIPYHYFAILVNIRVQYNKYLFDSVFQARSIKQIYFYLWFYNATYNSQVINFQITSLIKIFDLPYTRKSDIERRFLEPNRKFINKHTQFKLEYKLLGNTVQFYCENIGTNREKLENKKTYHIGKEEKSELTQLANLRPKTP